MAMMAITTNSSIKVKAAALVVQFCIFTRKEWTFPARQKFKQLPLDEHFFISLRRRLPLIIVTWLKVA
jgi:hypothetical protein